MTHISHIKLNVINADTMALAATITKNFEEPGV